ncbi:type II secretion system F family protein [Marinomonas transparens]|uniref:Type II secretion system F family protein n=1 Tax=Marinomonas transparens TaxID=2795388 RepID=A0A934JTQ0_9GAMM|nr:type II secretion system F family protein [Marinomonas transparens]MBJ7538127.1 type II secretion system F family protein [Marinomonas transparens]
MPWYKIKYDDGEIEYRFSHAEKEILFNCIKKGQWNVSITRWHPKKLNYKTLLTFYEEVQNALHSGLQLNEALVHLAQSSTHTDLANICKTILSELENGAILNTVLTKLADRHTAPYCQLLNSQGSREDCEESLKLSITQLNTLLAWSRRLLKAMVYPCCIIQIALLMSVLNTAFLSSQSLTLSFRLIHDIGIYLFCSLIQILIITSLYKGNACNWLETYSHSFRLTKFFSLLATTRKTGYPLQQALKSMPEYFQHKTMQHEILKVYYSLRLGHNYGDCFPQQWFPNESAIALHSAEKDGDIERALHLAAKEHERRWQKNVTFLEKSIPALCLFIAGAFVASTLLSLYAPLIETL